MKTIAVLVGSNRKDSLNLKFARALEKIASGRLAFDFIDVAAIPMFNDDHVADMPAPAREMKAKIKAADGLLFVTPEYNRSIPAVLKSAIDWGTRPPKENVFVGKRGAITGATGGMIGTAAAQMHLRTILVTVGVLVQGRPEVFFRALPGLIDEDFNITEEGTREFLTTFIDALADWVA
ncbi:MAG: NAD(P)H-dependent oxidoreductase [Rhodobiaceae bacterium]|nr:NAD(P)H-dependent oxidoreductase [Rhodobiaceae bacterium]